jgi:hypothetical protein
MGWGTAKNVEPYRFADVYTTGDGKVDPQGNLVAMNPRAYGGSGGGAQAKLFGAGSSGMKRR